jgi:hypothetical protein
MKFWLQSNPSISYMISYSWQCCPTGNFQTWNPFRLNRMFHRRSSLSYRWWQSFFACRRNRGCLEWICLVRNTRPRWGKRNLNSCYLFWIECHNWLFHILKSLALVASIKLKACNWRSLRPKWLKKRPML